MRCGLLEAPVPGGVARDLSSSSGAGLLRLGFIIHAHPGGHGSVRVGRGVGAPELGRKGFSARDVGASLHEGVRCDQKRPPDQDDQEELDQALGDPDVFGGCLVLDKLVAVWAVRRFG